MLERVPLLEKSLHDYAEVVAPGTIERIEALARPLQGARVLHVNATAYGGGVAELLATHVPLLRDLGMEAEWQVIRGSDEFFQITKAVHNGLQGADVEWTSARLQSAPPRLVVGEMAGELVLQLQLLFLEALEKVFVGVGSMLFFLDEGVKSGMLRFQFLDNCLVHRCLSFPQSVTTGQ